MDACFPVELSTATTSLLINQQQNVASSENEMDHSNSNSSVPATKSDSDPYDEEDSSPKEEDTREHPTETLSNISHHEESSSTTPPT